MCHLIGEGLGEVGLVQGWSKGWVGGVEFGAVLF